MLLPPRCHSNLFSVIRATVHGRFGQPANGEPAKAEAWGWAAMHKSSMMVDDVATATASHRAKRKPLKATRALRMRIWPTVRPSATFAPVSSGPEKTRKIALAIRLKPNRTSRRSAMNREPVDSLVPKPAPTDTIGSTISARLGRFFDERDLNIETGMRSTVATTQGASRRITAAGRGLTRRSPPGVDELPRIDLEADMEIE